MSAHRNLVHRCRGFAESRSRDRLRAVRRRGSSSARGSRSTWATTDGDEDQPRRAVATRTQVRPHGYTACRATSSITGFAHQRDENLLKRTSLSAAADTVLHAPFAPRPGDAGVNRDGWCAREMVATSCLDETKLADRFVDVRFARGSRPTAARSQGPVVYELDLKRRLRNSCSYDLLAGFDACTRRQELIRGWGGASGRERRPDRSAFARRSSRNHRSSRYETISSVLERHR